jgi:arylsulfatase
MWIHEGGICTPFIAHWPAVIGKKGQFSDSVGHVIDLMPTFAEIAGMALPKKRGELALMPPEGRSLLPAFRGEAMGSRQLGWEHEGNRGWRDGSWKLTGSYRNEWELYDLSTDRTECRNLASQFPDRVKAMATAWQAWADRVGVVPWTELPGSSYKPSATYRRKSERN